MVRAGRSAFFAGHGSLVPAAVSLQENAHESDTTVDCLASVFVTFSPWGVQMSVNMERQITINAKPETITIDTAQTAVIVADMQNDFGSKGGMFDRGSTSVPSKRLLSPFHGSLNRRAVRA